MAITRLLDGAAMAALDYRCAARPGDRPFVEQHGGFSLSFVRKGSFGCRTRGKSYELVAGALLVGHPGDEYLCTHEHHGGGDRCLSFSLSPALVDKAGGGAALWRIGAVPPLPALALCGERAWAAAEGASAMSLEEAGTLLVQRFVACVAGSSAATRASPGDRRRAVEAALWIDENAGESLSLEAMAARAGVSRFHFLRLFRAVVGLTPHQYLIRCRLRRAVRLMADDRLGITAIAFACGFGDLANFVRTFRRAAGETPSAFRQRRCAA